MISRALRVLLVICNAWTTRVLMSEKESLVIIWLCNIKEKIKKK